MTSRPPSLLARMQNALKLTPPKRLEASTSAWVLPETAWSGRLTMEEMQRMGAICPPKSIHRSEVIYRKGDEADSLFILLEGHVKITLPMPSGVGGVGAG